MNQQEIEDGNELIATFMDVKVNNQAHFESIELPLIKGGAAKFGRKRYGTYDVNGSLRSVFELKYHTSWDWLMLVVEMIESLEKKYYVKIMKGSLRDNLHRCFILDFGGHFKIEAESESKIEAVWLAVVEFIKHHKNQR